MAIKQYKFYLDNTLLADDPVGWADGKIVFKRNTDFNALFYEYATDLNFWGDGYSYLISQFDTAICTEVNLRIEKKCDEAQNYDIIFEGIIKLREAVIDERKCMIKCNAEDNSQADRILNFGDAEFNYGLDVVVPFGTATITAAPVKAIYMTNQDNTLNWTRQGYYVFDVLQYMLSYMTNDNAVLTSDYFNTTSTVRYKFNINFLSVAQLTATGNMVFNVTNYLNQTYNITIAINPVAATTLTLISNAFQYTSTGTPLVNYYANDYKYVAKATNDGVSVVSIENDLPFTINSITYANNPASYSITETQALVDGMKKLALFDGANLRTSPTAKPPATTFKKLFSELHKQFDLGMSIKNVLGVIQIRIEPLQYFFNTSSAVLTLDNVPEVKFTVSDRFTKDMAKVGDGKRNDNLRSVLMDVHDWYGGGNCHLNKIELKNQFIVDWNQILTQSFTMDSTLDDNMFLLECTDSTHFFDADAVVYTHVSTTGVTGFVMNAHLTNYWKIRRWLFSFTSDVSFGDKTITNDALRVKKEYNFTYPISFTDYKLLKASDVNYIVFRKSDNPIDNKYGWIDEISYDIKTSHAQFKLIST